MASKITTTYAWYMMGRLNKIQWLSCILIGCIMYGMVFMLSINYNCKNNNNRTTIAERASDIITQTNSDKQNGMVENLTLFQTRK